MHILFIILAIAYGAFSSPIFFLKQITNQSEPITLKNKCLKFLYENNVQPGNLVMILHSTTSATALMENGNNFISMAMASTNVIIAGNSIKYLQSMKKNKKRNFYSHKFSHKIGTVSFYVIIVSIDLTMEELIETLVKWNIFDSRANFLLVFENTYEKDECHTILLRSFNIFWKYYIYNTLVMLCQRDNCSVYNWFPYDKASECGSNRRTFEKLFDCFQSTNDCFQINYATKTEILFEKHSNRCKSQEDVTLINNTKAEYFNKEKLNKNKTDLHQNAKESIDKNEKNAEKHDKVKMSFEQKNWDKKYIKEFFAYNYRPYGIIEFRKWKNVMDGIYTTNIVQNVQKINYKNTPHFLEKIPSNMGGCKFAALLFAWPPFVTPMNVPWIGMEHKMILDISRYMNFELVEKYYDFSRKLSGSDKSRVLVQVLVNSSAQLSFGNIYPHIESRRYFDNTIGYLYDHVNWVVPLARKQPMWLNLIRCFRIMPIVIRKSSEYF